MYLDYFGLRADPFPLYPSLKFVYASTAFEEAMAHMAYGLEQNEDIILITGPIGTGKTLAVHSLLSSLGKLYRTALVNVTQVEFPELLKLILEDLDAPVVGRADRADLLAALKAQVRQAHAAGGRLLVVIDEAQNLSPETLEGVRLLTNLGQLEGPTLQLILSGQPDLERTINLPQLAQLRQRIRVHYRLETLTRKELEGYIEHRLKVAGCQKRLFRPKAIEVIHAASSGVPRLVNILASRALLSAFVAGKEFVDAEHVELQDLPAADPQVQPAPVPTPAPVRASAAPAPAIERADIGRPAASPPSRPRDGSWPPLRRRGFRGRRLMAALVALLVLAVVAVVFVVVPMRRAGGRTGAARVTGMTAPRDTLRAAAQQQRQMAPPGPGTAPSPAPPARVPASAVNVAKPAENAPAQPVPSAESADRAGGGMPAAGGSSATLAELTSVGGRAAPAGPAKAADLTPAPVDTSAPAGRGPLKPPPAAAASYAVHVHSFRTRERTDADLTLLRSLGYPCFYRPHEVEGVIWERVYVGPYGTLAEAQVVAHKLQAEGSFPYSLVVKIDNGSF